MDKGFDPMFYCRLKMYSYILIGIGRLIFTVDVGICMMVSHLALKTSKE